MTVEQSNGLLLRVDQQLDIQEPVKWLNCALNLQLEQAMQDVFEAQRIVLNLNKEEVGLDAAVLLVQSRGLELVVDPIVILAGEGSGGAAPDCRRQQRASENPSRGCTVWPNKRAADGVASHAV
jgi:hypothetical protein